MKRKKVASPASSDPFSAYRRFQQAVLAQRRGPVLAEVEVTTRCTLSCHFCPREALTRPRGDLPPASAESLARNLRHPCLRAVLLSGLGEPTLHRELPALVACFRRHLAVPVGVVTNAAFLDRLLLRRLLESGVGFFHISVAAGADREGESLPASAGTEQLHGNLSALFEICAGKVPVAANALFAPEVRHRGKGLARELRRWPFRSVYLSPIHNRGGVLYRRSPPERRQRCWVYAHALFITWEGRVLACCQDLPGEHVLGDLTAEPLEKILRRKSEKRKRILQSERCSWCDFALAEGPPGRRGRERTGSSPCGDP